MIITDEFKFNFDLAYNTYSMTYDAWDKISKKAQKRARRQIESSVREAGFNGKSTGLISVKAFETVIKQKKGLSISKDERLALEHPVTHKNIALHCLNSPAKLSFEEFFAVWIENLVTTYTTNEENQGLRKFQSKFTFGVDCWKKMYEDAGIVLMERPKLNTKVAKQKYGIV